MYAPVMEDLLFRKYIFKIIFLEFPEFPFSQRNIFPLDFYAITFNDMDCQ